ncbi:MAG: hypothetical protein NPIRA01_07360 [Nitrospirales bacterium]|nr:MAG: hypothetical protein NPIRA01_07360 [Nitrospirales bacterium]
MRCGVLIIQLAIIWIRYSYALVWPQSLEIQQVSEKVGFVHLYRICRLKKKFPKPDNIQGGLGNVEDRAVLARQSNYFSDEQWR